MGLFSDILLTVDFDRTLTGPDSRIPQRNIEAIRYFMENGGAFTLNTGRSTNTMGKLLETLPVNAPFLLYNGSAAYENGQLLDPVTIDLPLWETLEEVHAAFPDMNLEVQGVSTHYLIHTLPGYEDFYDSLGWSHSSGTRQTDMGPFLKFSLFGQTRQPNVGHLFSGTPEELARMDQAEQWLRETYGDKVTVFRAAPRIIDIHAAGISKGIAARTLQKRLGRKILVCVGDAENDIAMLDNCDFAYCPADGILADRYETVCGCGQGAIADVIYEKIPGILQLGLDNL